MPVRPLQRRFGGSRSKPLKWGEFTCQYLFNKAEINLDVNREPLYKEATLIRSYEKAGCLVGCNDTTSSAG
jgi:hypothetical protein